MCYDVLVFSLLYVEFCNIDSNKLVNIVFMFVILKILNSFYFSGYFWHITDLHLDTHYYSHRENSK